jgi:CRISPR-associated endonuclease/helicase Cas3
MMRVAWGKTDPEKRPSHHLIHHSMDVAAVLERLVRNPTIADRLRRAAGRELTDGERAWMAAFAFLHDVGKLSPRFQAKAWPDADGRETRSHLDEGWRWLASARKRPDAMGGLVHALFGPLVRSRAGDKWIQALFAHHGRPCKAGNAADWPNPPAYDWKAEEAGMGKALGAWFPNAEWGDPAALARPRLVHLFAGLLALADWIGSDVSAFPHELKPDLIGYGERAREQAEQALHRFALSNTPWPAEAPTFAALTRFEPRGVQRVVAELPLDVALAIVEAETGSGKTEAALMHFARLRSAGRVDALYFAVPTRAAASQLLDRIHKVMENIGGPIPILAIPGQLRAGEAEGVRLPGYEVRWDDGGHHWAAEHATRFLAAPVAVGTIDQVLMAGLQVKHAHLRGSVLSRSLLVIDEVHASDAYMNRIARGLVRDHLALGGHALLMSATLGSAERAEWLDQAIPDLEEAKATPYPAVWRSGAREPVLPSAADSGGREKRVAPMLVPTMAATEAARITLDAARRGARVLVIRNTVESAIETWRRVAEEEPALCLAVAGIPALHHSRFAAEDRRALDKAVEDAFGKASPSRPVIAVGTQTLEQSLDIDADVLVTDLCPMDVLLQRIGRLHRHNRERPEGFGEPVVHILCPENGLDALAREKHFENGLGGWEARGVLNGVYIDLRSLEATRRLAAAQPIWTIPADNRALVEAATHPDALDALDREMGWQGYTNAVVAKALADEQYAGMLVLDRSAAFPDSFPDADETAQTRLGAQGPLLELPPGTVGPFGHAITTIAPPAHWCRGMTGSEKVEIEAAGARLTIRAGDRSFAYGPEGLGRSKSM